MIKSMTGFGKAEVTIGDKKITAEIKSLNSKQLDLSVKTPPVYRSLDSEIRAMGSKRLQRGKVDIYINVDSGSGASGVVINKQLFAEYYRQLAEIGTGSGMGWGTEVMNAQIVPAILKLPEVICNNNNDVSEDEEQAVMSAVSGALKHLDEFRCSEGAILIEDMLQRVGKIERYKEDVVPYEKVRVENIKNRIRESIEAVGVPLDTNRLEQEMIFYVEKLDITEEKVRLTNHCKYFLEVASSEDNAGRKLGFIAQEMGREINTLGSKANNSDIQRIVVAMKDELEKIKEQLLNIL